MKYLVAFLVLSGCAKSGNNDGKNTFSAWTNGSSVTIDMSHGNGTSGGTFSSAGVIQCTCTFSIAGGQLTGTLDVSACAGGGSCPAHEGAFTYRYHGDDTLDICKVSDGICMTYY